MDKREECVWRESNRFWRSLAVGCRESLILGKETVQDGWRFCPYCGLPIKVAE